MKKNRLVIGIIVIFLLSLLLSFLVYNFNIFVLDKSDRGLKNIDLSKVSYLGFDHSNNDSFTSTDEKSKIIKIPYEGYVKKLVIKYKANENFLINISYKGNDYFEKKVKKSKSESFVKMLDKSILLIDDYVDGLTLDFSEGSDFTIKSIQINNSLQFNFYLFYFIFCNLICIFVLYLYLKKNLFNGKIEKLFLSLVLLLGSLYIILGPYVTSYSWDDQIHFSNIYKIFELDGRTDWTKSSSLMTEIRPFSGSIDTFEERNEVNDFLNLNDTKIVNSINNSRLIAYTQAGYIIPGLVYKICSIFGVSFIIKMILSKFSILLFYSLIMYYSIKIIPHGKRILTVFGLFPSILFLTTQFSYDSPIIAMICLFIAQYLKIMQEKKSIVTLKEVLILFISIIFASFIKAVYIPLILLLLFIPKEKFSNKTQNKFFKVGVILIFIFILSTFVLPTVTETNSIGDIRGGNTSVSGQLKSIIHHPLGYLSVLNDSALKRFTNKLMGDQTLYSYSYIRTGDFENVYNILLIVFIFTVITDSYINNKNESINGFIKMFNILLVIGTILLIWTALYLSFTPVAAVDIFGVQNRYFIPLIIPIVLILFSNKKIYHDFDMIKYDFYVMLLVSFCILWSLYSNYFINFCN